MINQDAVVLESDSPQDKQQAVGYQTHIQCMMMDRSVSALADLQNLRYTDGAEN